VKKSVKKPEKYLPHDLVVIVTASHSGLFVVTELVDDRTVRVREPGTGLAFRVGPDDIKGGPWRPIWHR